MNVEVAIVGGGPAGLAVAIGAARLGLSTVLFERGPLAPDKACGEGVMPPGLRQLAALGVLEHIPSTDRSPMRGVRYVLDDGTAAEGRLRGEGGLGVRRLALVDALTRGAQAAGVQLRPHCAVRGQRLEADARVLSTDVGEVRAQMLIAADGLHSPLRHELGLEGVPDPRAKRRFGLRQHFRLAPWTDLVEVHLTEGAEAYLTPCGDDRVGVAFLWEPDASGGSTSFEALLRKFPAIESRLRGAQPDSKPRGAGPFLHAAKRVTAERFALVGDAAGYVDAITGEGVSLALVTAAALVEALPGAVKGRGRVELLRSYERAFWKHFRPYRRGALAVLSVASSPRGRSFAVGFLRKHPRIFDAVLSKVVGAEAPRQLPAR